MELDTRLSIEAMHLLDLHLALKTNTTGVSLNFVYREKVGEGVVASSIKVLVFTEKIGFTPRCGSFLVEAHL